MADHIGNTVAVDRHRAIPARHRPPAPDQGFHGGDGRGQGGDDGQVAVGQAVPELDADVVLDAFAGLLSIVPKTLAERFQAPRQHHVRRGLIVCDLECEREVRWLVLERTDQDGGLLLGVLPTTC